MDIRNLDLNLLPILNALLEERNVSATARRLKMSQPAVSAGLSRLRHALGDELFIRGRSGMKPTAFALNLERPLKTVLGLIENELLRAPTFEPALTRRCFTFSTSDIGEQVFFPRLLKMLRRAAPHATLRSLAIPHDRLERAMDEGAVDCAIGYFPDLTGANIISQPLFEHPFVCLVRQDHPVIGSTMSLEQFLAAEHLVVSQEGRSQEIFERMMERLGHSRRILLHIPHFMSVPALIAETDMISIVPLTLGIVSAQTAAVRYVTPPLAIPAIPLKQFWHRRMDSDPALQWLRAMIAEEFVGRDPFVPVEPNASLAKTPTVDKTE